MSERDEAGTRQPMSGIGTGEQNGLRAAAQRLAKEWLESANDPAIHSVVAITLARCSHELAALAGDPAFGDEWGDSGKCSDCGAPHEWVRLGKLQATCECWAQCPTHGPGSIQYHPEGVVPRLSGYFCLQCHALAGDLLSPAGTEQGRECEQIVAFLRADAARVRSEGPEYRFTANRIDRLAENIASGRYLSVSPPAEQDSWEHPLLAHAAAELRKEAAKIKLEGNPYAAIEWERAATRVDEIAALFGAPPAESGR